MIVGLTLLLECKESGREESRIVSVDGCRREEDRATGSQERDGE